MAQVYVKYNPYRLSTEIKVNGREIETDSTLYKFVKGKRLQEWIGEFPEMLTKELNTVDLDIEFCGMDLDWDDFEDAFQTAKSTGIVKTAELKYIEGQSAEDVTQKIVEIFCDLQKGPIKEEFEDPKLKAAFEKVNDASFPVNVLATMSSGKSTLINALLGRKLMPSKNEACTATITEILDNDKDHFSAHAYDQDGNEIREIDKLTYDSMSKLNEDQQVSRIAVEGDIPFLDARDIALMLVDTPGPNNSQNGEHDRITYESIQKSSNNLILYVMNGTQLRTCDDDKMLNEIAKKINNGGKLVRDRFLFVINKMDSFNPEEESIEKTIESAKEYLNQHGIMEPQIFPCSAFTALNIRSCLGNVDIDNLTRSQEKQLPSAARDTLPMIDKFIEYPSMHLEKYTTLSPSAQRELNYKLKLAQDKNNTKEQALIHCGIYSIESAITAYVKKYAKTKKIKDLVETFQGVLESSRVLAEAKDQIMTNEKAARACAERAKIINETISGGKEAQEFKQKIKDLNPMEEINNKAKDLSSEAMMQASKIFADYGQTIHSKEEAERLVKQFAKTSLTSMASMAAELEEVINHELIHNSKQILLDYQEKLKRIDQSVGEEELDFATEDIIKGELAKMEANLDYWRSQEFVSETVDEVGEEREEEHSYYVKTGQETEQVVVGSHKEKKGTERVKVGSHKKKVGTQTVKNPNKKWWKIFTPKYVEKDIYEEVDDYEEKDIYETVYDLKTITRDTYEEKKEKIKIFSVRVSDIQEKLVAKFRQDLGTRVKDACSFAEEQVQKMNAKFSEMLDQADELIVQKYKELEACVMDQKNREAELEKNRKVLGWIEANKNQIDKILDM